MFIYNSPTIPLPLGKASVAYILTRYTIRNRHDILLTATTKFRKGKLTCHTKVRTNYSLKEE